MCLDGTLHSFDKFVGMIEMVREICWNKHDTVTQSKFLFIRLAKKHFHIGSVNGWKGS